MIVFLWGDFMRIKVVFFLFLFVTLLLENSAKATTIELGSEAFSYGYAKVFLNNQQTLSIGEKGTIEFLSNSLWYEEKLAVYANIPDNSIINFSYTYNSIFPKEAYATASIFGDVYENGEYYERGDIYKHVHYMQTKWFPYFPNGGTVNLFSADHSFIQDRDGYQTKLLMPLGFVGAQLNSDNKISTFIKNTSGATMLALSHLTSIKWNTNSLGSVTVNYQVSPVPIPATLPVFGIGLFGFMVRRLYKKM